MKKLGNSLVSIWQWALVRFLCACFCTVGCSTSKTPEKSGLDNDITVYAVGIRKPSVFNSTEVTVANEERVIGVSVGGWHRAYLIRAMSMPAGFDPRPSQVKEFGRHVVNDLLVSVPITVTYCDLSRCARVLTSTGSESLDVAVGGMKDGGLQLFYKGRLFGHFDPQLPLSDYGFEISTWGKWKSTHPDCSIYIGPASNES